MEELGARAIPHYCVVCKHRGQYYGRLVFPSEEERPLCPNHTVDDKQHLLPVVLRSDSSVG